MTEVQRGIRENEVFSEMKKVSTYKSDALTSKMWILPDGRPISLNTWHYRWILGHAKEVAKFGIDVKKLPDNEEAVRKVALKAGFFRVNYEHTNGTITVEGMKIKLSKKIKDAIFVISMDNISSIDRFRLTLFNDTITKIVADDEVVLFTYRDEEEKIAAIDDMLK